ncbi:MAG TPA: hypothetical protein VJU84_12415 [Pyrinomonadaceae bacterium]|nr:hypothetical protein [Pyrinomonadaceae bacterium]
MDDNNTQVMADDGQSFPSFIALRARHSELLQREPETDEAKFECLQEIEDFIARVQATGKILSDSEARRGAQNILNYWLSTLYRQDQVARLVTLADYEPNLTYELLDVSCPYPGVNPFTEKQSQFFFGRQRQIDYMVGRLKEDRLLVIVGPSGSGKTSLVQAGLIPQLKREKPDGLEHYFFPTFSPGTDPLKSLALMIKEAQGPKVDDPHWVNQQVQKFREDKNHLVKLIKEITDRPIVIFIDEGEELYERSVPMLLRPFENIVDLDNSKATIEPFLDNLLGVIQGSEKRNIVIIARRAGDFEPYVKRLPGRVKEVFEPARVILPPLSANELRDAIEKPAELLGVNFEEIVAGVSEGSEPVSVQQTMVQSLIKDISSEPVGLPLLQFVLPRLWEAREGKVIPDRAYSEMQSCQAYLAKTAEAFYASLNTSEQRDCGYLIRHLVKLDRDLKPHIYPIRRRVLCPGGRRQSQIESLIKRLEEKQLLRITKGRTPSDDLIELVHDSLFRNWPKLNSWIEEKRADRMFRRVRLGILTAAVIALAVSAAIFFYGRAQHKEKARELARLSGKQFNYDRFDLALLLGRKAYELNSQDPATRSNLLRLLHALQSTARPQSFLFEKGFEADDIIFSSEHGNPQKLAAVDTNGNIVIWTLGSEPAKTTLPAGATYPLSFSTDGKLLAAASQNNDDALIVWNLETNNRKSLTVDYKYRFTSLAFKPDSYNLVAGNNAGHVIEWDLSQDEPEYRTLYQHAGSVNSVVFNSDGSLLATGGDDGWVVLSDPTIKTIARRRFFAAGGERKPSQPGLNPRIISLAFKQSETGNWLAAGGDDHVFIWDVETGSEDRTFSTGPHPAGVLVAFRDDENLLTAFSFDGTLVQWDLGADGPVGKQFYHSGASSSAAFSSNGKLLAMPTDDGVVLWELADLGRIEPGSIVQAGAVQSIAFAPSRSERLMASLATDGTLKVWPADAENKAIGSTIEANVSGFSINWNGSVLAIAFDDATISLRDIKDNREIKTLDVKTGKVVPEPTPNANPTPVAEAGANAVPESPSALASLSPYSISKVIFPRENSPWIAALVKIKSSDSEQTKILRWDTSQENSTEIASAPGTVLTSLAISPDGKALAWASYNSSTKKSTVFVKREEQQEEPLSCRDKTNCLSKVTSLAFSADRLAAGLEDGEIIFWDSNSDQRIDKRLMQVAGGVVTDLAFGVDGTVLAAVSNKKSGDDDLLVDPNNPTPRPTNQRLKPGEITLWDVKTQEPIGNALRGHQGHVSTIAFDADGTMLASGSDAERDQNIILWDLNINTANQRFCDIAGCGQERSEIATQLKEESWAQTFYIKANQKLRDLYSWVSGFFRYG